MTTSLERFIKAQTTSYDLALAEIKAGKKRTHWMWFIFPQIEGLGASQTSIFYSIQSLQEARGYLNHPLLGKRLVECTQAVLEHPHKTAHEIFSTPDDLKLRSCMTLFASICDQPSVFDQVLDIFFDGESDPRTLEILSTCK